jgi:aspartyl-tRNA(Asn)/glutamyl-tRNA(Gln) amidotransferase subunit A
MLPTSIGDDLPDTIAALASLIKARELSPLALVEHLLRRIDLVNPAIHAFITVSGEHALAQARRAECEIVKGDYRGPLHGMPFGVKDIYETAGIRTTGHSKVYEEYVPQADAYVLGQLYAAGAVLLGKQALHELAHGGPSFDLPWPPARNPWNVEHFTGGSSSGSAAAVAAGLGLFALGTDTGGSVRAPASLCGLVGMKPTFGLVSRRGVIPNCYSLDHCGPITRTVEDCAIVLQAIAAHDPRDRSSAPGAHADFLGNARTDLKGVSIGVVRHFWEEDLPAPPELSAATEEALRVLRRLGARLEEVRLRAVGAYSDVWTLIEAPETFSIQRDALIQRAGDFGQVFLGRTLIACLIEAADYVDAQRARARLADEMTSVFAPYDVIFTAGAGPAPRLSPALASWPSPNRFQPAAVTGNPALVVPCGFSRAGLPMSMQLIGKPFEDAKLLGIARAYEQATGWWKKRPSISSVAVAAPIACEPAAASTAAVDQTLRDCCAQAARQAGLRLTESQLALLARAAPHVLGMIERVRRVAERSPEPASVFSFPRAGCRVGTG